MCEVVVNSQEIGTDGNNDEDHHRDVEHRCESAISVKCPQLVCGFWSRRSRRDVHR